MRLWFQKPPAQETKGQFEDVLMRIVAAQEGTYGALVTPENCMRSPTVHAIVTAISRRLSVTPVHVYERGESNGRETKKKLPNHSVATLLQKPNTWQSRVDFWQDAASVFVRHGNFYAYKARGLTGPIRRLEPLHPMAVEPRMDHDTGDVTYRVTQTNAEMREYPIDRIFHARGPARNFLEGDSPIKDCEIAIALEILAEKFGHSFFQNGALPLLIFKYMEGSARFKDPEQEKQFIDDFQEAFGGKRRFRAMLLPKGIEKDDPVAFDNEKAQFIEARKFQRTVIAGAFGVPPHLVGDLERATYNNVEQQDQDFTLNVIMPVAQAFESAMERDLLTQQDRNSGVVIRFNLDSILRADFKSRQEGLALQRQNGVITADEWREREGLNPLPEGQGGGEVWRQGPSGQNAGDRTPRNEEQGREDDPET